MFSVKAHMPTIHFRSLPRKNTHPPEKYPVRLRTSTDHLPPPLTFSTTTSPVHPPLPPALALVHSFYIRNSPYPPAFSQIKLIPILSPPSTEYNSCPLPLSPQIRIRDPNQGGRDITEEIMSGVRTDSTPTPPHVCDDPAQVSP